MSAEMFFQSNNSQAAQQPTAMEEVKIGEEVFYKIAQVDRMRPFFMTIVSDSDHWLFVSSNGGISAGRKNSEYAVFPYYTDDKITESAEITGSKTILRVWVKGTLHIWEPFSARSEALFRCQRNLYKSRYGNKIIFEEANEDLGITFAYAWNTSDRYGFVRRATLVNHAAGQVSIEMLDGLQNILPYGVGSDLQSGTSNLADAYKRSELLPEAGLGIFALSAIIVDKAEPSEALKANAVWSVGIEQPLYLLSTAQLQHFRKGANVIQEEDVKGEKGAYFVGSNFDLSPGEEKTWWMVANVNQSQSAIIQLADSIQNNPQLVNEVMADVEAGTKKLVALVAAADGVQCCSDDLVNTRHFSNVLFNIMRGGIFDNGYQIGPTDFARYFRKANAVAYHKNEQSILSLPAEFPVFMLKGLAAQSGDADFIRLATEYMPLKFSRRHGDPSRPWNKFTINTKSEIDGSKILDYEGNWRDIFQNWEALAHSYPAFIEGMIFKFLNASTFDGYNPYRVTKDGFDWETIEPDNPWSYIGYWGDHQIIYLLKFLEFAQNHYPSLLAQLPGNDCFVYANVPYTIKTYQEILANPKDTIAFNHEADTFIRERMIAYGADGALVVNGTGGIHRVNFTEKILAVLLAKLTNLVPGGGIWMNTQRPEWNDANNALVGNGLSMVTLYYLRRFLAFIQPLFDAKTDRAFLLSAELHGYFNSVATVFENYAGLLTGAFSNAEQKKMLDDLGEASSRFRTQVYENSFSGDRTALPGTAVVRFIETALAFTEHSIRANQRADGLYHTYNLLSYDSNQLHISYLSEMLEGQVAVLSSGYLSPTESLQVLDALRNSLLYRPDQDSYILYPNKALPSFLQKNTVPGDRVQQIPLLQQLLEVNGGGIIEKDIHGGFHFNGNFKNAQDLDAALLQLDSQYASAVQQDRAAILALFEQVFNHKAFTGRSGTFFAYEGLGSVYWHMVSKLLLAVMETCMNATRQQADATTLNRLYQHFDAIQKGIGVHKSPIQYGAFPTDPYSHTPLGKGAQQPGMTGQVKEDILSRFGELGVQVSEGRLVFKPVLLKRNQFVSTDKQVEYINAKGERQSIALEGNSLFFTYCQVPVVYVLSGQPGIEITKNGGSISIAESTMLDEKDSAAVFERSGEVHSIKVFLTASALRD
jgi:hypothetical protein